MTEITDLSPATGTPAAEAAGTPPQGVAAGPVLVVDLDGTLCRTDTLHEALFAQVSADPAALIGLSGPLRAGKADFKRHVAGLGILPGAELPLNETVITLLREARAEGRRTALVSASDQRQVEAVATHVGLFDEVFGSNGPVTGAHNLSGAAKAAFLTERYGARGFDYVGDASVDVPVWAAARQAYTIGAGAKLRAAAEAAADGVIHLDPQAGGTARWRPYLRAMRPHQWSKNILVFLPMMLAHDLGAVWPVFCAFVAFCLTASSVYLINDLVDLKADRAHPRKRLRPFAAGDIPIAHGVAMAGGLILAAVLISLLLTPPAFFGILVVYYVTTFAYSLYLKRKLIVDVLTLAGLYTIRIIGGGVAASVELSPWILGFSMFLFLSLAAVKRQAELTDQVREGRKSSSGRAYETDDLPVLRDIALSAGYAAVLVFALYISSDHVKQLYSSPEILWMICPLLLYWVSRMVMMTHRGYMTDDPIVFAATDRISQLVVLCGGAIFVLAGLW